MNDRLIKLVLLDTLKVFEEYQDDTRMKAEQIQLLIERANEWLHPSDKMTGNNTCGCWDSLDGKFHLMCSLHADKTC